MKDTETLTEPLLDEGGNDAGARTKILALNTEDPLFGLTDEQVKQSLEIFGKNEVSVDSMFALINNCCSPDTQILARSLFVKTL